MFVNSDFSELLKLFADKQVKYLVIGGYAVVQHAEPRFTKDLDLLISTDSQNATAVFEALLEFGAPLNDMAPSDFSVEGYFYQMGVPPIRVDVLMGIPGVNFEDAWERRMTVSFADLPVDFISLNDLIAAKTASARPQDLIDVELLKQAKENQKKAE